MCKYQFMMYFSLFTNTDGFLKRLVLCQVDAVYPQEFSDSKTPRYLFQGPTANFIAVLVETGGGIDLKNHHNLRWKILVLQQLARRSNVVSLVLLLFECPICIWNDHPSVDSIDMGENLCTQWAKQSSPTCNNTSNLFFVSSEVQTNRFALWPGVALSVLVRHETSQSISCLVSSIWAVQPFKRMSVFYLHSVCLCKSLYGDHLRDDIKHSWCLKLAQLVTLRRDQNIKRNFTTVGCQNETKEKTQLVLFGSLFDKCISNNGMHFCNDSDSVEPRRISKATATKRKKEL